MADFKGVSDILCNLVDIPSVNPMVLGGKSTDGEGELAAFVHQTLKAAAIDVTFQPVHPGRANVIGHLDRAGPAIGEDVILLSAHMDTYPASHDGDVEYKAIHKDGQIFGRGSADAKGSLAAMMAALIAASKSRQRREVYLVASVDEEFGMTGVRQLLSSGIKASMAITGEPTLLQPIVAQKGIVRFKIRVQGNAAHAAYASGRNAILDLESVLATVRQFAIRLSEQTGQDLGIPTLCPTRVESDGDMNKTPSSSTLWFDARFLPGDDAASFLSRLRKHLRTELDPSIHFEVEAPTFVSPPNRCPLDKPIVRELFRSIEKVRGSCIPGSFAYGSEAGYLSQMSASSLVLGPGNPKYSHAAGESVEVREIEDAARIFREIIAP